MHPILLRLRPRALTACARAIVISLTCAGALAGPLADGVNALPGPAPMYTVTDLGTLGGAYSWAQGINNRGQVVGFSAVAGMELSHAFMYYDGRMHDLGPPGTANSAVAINDAGQIVGTTSTVFQYWTQHAFLYDTSGMHDLGPAGARSPGDDYSGQSYAAAINASGQVVGTAFFTSPLPSRPSAFLWQNGVMQPLNVSDDPSSASWAFSINASGQVLVQVSNSTAHTTQILIWQNGVTHELVPPAGQSIFGSALNDRGQVIGSLGPPGAAHSHAMLYDETGCHDLGTLGGASSYATGINNLGQVVGYSSIDASDTMHPFLYTGGVMYDLENQFVSPVTWDRFCPYGINDQGQIIGDAVWHPGTDDETSHAVLLTPARVPSLGLSATTLDFSGQPAGATQTLIITNTGDAPLNIQGLALTGPDAGSFRVAGGGPMSLSPGWSQPVTVIFSPATIASRGARIAAARTTAAGRSAALVIRDNDPHAGVPHQVTLKAAAPAAPTPPAAPTGLTATLTAANQVALTWSDNSNNEKAFAIWRQTGGRPFERVGVVAPNRTSFTDASVSPRTTYTYEVRATNDVYASAWSNLATITTLEAPPAAPAKLTATVVSVGEIDLAWTSGGGNETGVSIFRQTSGGEWQRIGVVSPRVTRYADRSVKPGTSYVYRVRTHNDHYASAWTNSVSANTPAAR